MGNLYVYNERIIFKNNTIISLDSHGLAIIDKAINTIANNAIAIANNAIPIAIALTRALSLSTDM
jgi:hypothetical protein